MAGTKNDSTVPRSLVSQSLAGSFQKCVVHNDATARPPRTDARLLFKTSHQAFHSVRG
jgi:hypothetical protein